MATPCDKSTSSVYSILSNVVRSRLPILPSLRQSARDVVSRPIHHVRSLSSPLETTIPESSTNRNRAGSFNSIHTLRSTADTITNTPSMIDVAQSSQALIPSRFDPQSTTQRADSGSIDWDIAGAGVRLWLNARAQAETEIRDPALLRSMHVDALKYMIMALPAELSTLEIDTLQSILPSRVMGTGDQIQRTTVASRPNLLRQGIAQAVCWIVALMLIVVPLLMTAINRVLIYEHEHRVAQRVFNGSAALTKSLGERGLVLGDACIRFKDTPLGKVCLESIAWVVEGVAGGVNDGLVLSTSGRPDLLELHR